MDIWDVYQAVLYKINKDQRGEAYSPDEFNRMLKLVNTDYFKLKYGLPEEYRPGSQLPRQAWQNSQKITDDLRNCVVHMGGPNPPLYVGADGYALLPADYIHQSTVYSDYGDIEVLNDDDFSGRLFKSLKKPTLKHAICRVMGALLEFAPKTINSVNFTYLRMPKTAFLDYTIIADEPTYLPIGGVHDGSVLPPGTPSRTTQLEWSEQCHSDIVALMESYATDNLKDNTGHQITEQRKTRGI